MGATRTVLLTTEGTYPHQLGGVSTWCDLLVRELPDVRFLIFAVVMNPYVTERYEIPQSVERVISVPLWGTQDPSEHRLDLPFAEIFLRKQRTTPEVVTRVFLPPFQELIEQIVTQGSAPQALGHTLVSLYHFFQMYDYQSSFKTEAIWNYFRERVLRAAADGVWPEPTVFDAVQALGWVYRFLTILNTPVPTVDLIHSSAAAFCGLPGIIGKIQHGTPYILTEHGVYLREQFLAIGRSNMSPFAKKFLLSLVRAMIVANLYYADDLAPVCSFNARWERRLGANPRKIHVIYNGVSPRIFAPEGQTSEGRASRETAAAPRPGRRGARESLTLRVLTVARSDPNKDLETLLRAAAIVHERLPRVTFRIQGARSEPKYHEAMLKLRDELGLGDVVEFAGHTAQIADVYRRSDIVVQSSVSEAFPYSVIEAMMVGKPVIATEVGGTAEALADTGVLVPSRDPARLAMAIVMLAEDPVLRRRLGQAARDRALSLFTTDQTIRAISATYREAVRAKRIKGPSRRHQELALARGYALARLGLPAAALVQLQDALDMDPGAALAPVLLAQMAHLERRLGRTDRQASHLVRAWLLEHIKKAS